MKIQRRYREPRHVFCTQSLMFLCRRSNHFCANKSFSTEKKIASFSPSCPPLPPPLLANLCYEAMDLRLFFPRLCSSSRRDPLCRLYLTDAIIFHKNSFADSLSLAVLRVVCCRLPNFSYFSENREKNFFSTAASLPAARSHRSFHFFPPAPRRFRAPLRSPVFFYISATT